ncbi:MAG: elongation factor P [Clostridiales bacterium]|jgi:elongation factor P|nr:elongation factor P [Clostridiales bacterium]
MGFLTASDFRKGNTFEMDGNVMVIVDFQHVKPGKGAAFVRAKIKNVITGSIIERTFNTADKFELAVIERKEMQYLYSDGDLYYFMDPENYEQTPLNQAQVENALYFIKENTNATISFFKGAAFLVEPPNFVELEIISCEPGAKGDTVTNSTKPATLETGLVINVPMFVNQGDVIKIDTRDGGEYMSRV